MVETKQKQILADIKACRKQVFKLCGQHTRLTKQKKQKEAAKVFIQITALTRFLEEVQRKAFI